MLRLEGGDVFPRTHRVLRGIDLSVGPARTTRILGANGAGKGTVLKAVAGLGPARGRVPFDGRDISRLSAPRREAAGIGLVLERRRLFNDLGLAENLSLGAWLAPAAEGKARLGRVIARLPALRDMLRRRAGDLSGGQQQRVAMGRGPMARPRRLMPDEPFPGLSPAAVDELRGPIEALAADVIAILFNEQDVRLSLAMSGQAILLEAGRLVAAGPSDAIGASEMVQPVHLGTAATAEVAS